AGQRKNEGADPPGRCIALRGERCQRIERTGAVAADRQAQSQAAACFITVETAERGAVIVLCVRLAAKQIVSEPAVTPNRREWSAKLLRALEIRQRSLRLAIRNRNRAHSGLRQR